ncbi:MAG: hypothetical protein M3247_01370 [Thermoproteota archaeon]|nr:hypothetical protein [Thermoproteota archaeon]
MSKVFVVQWLVRPATSLLLMSTVPYGPARPQDVTSSGITTGKLRASQNKETCILGSERSQ